MTTLPLLGKDDPPEYSWLYSVPAVVFTGGFLAAASTGMSGLVQAGYLTSSILCIGKSISVHLIPQTNSTAAILQAPWPVYHLS